MVQEQSRLGPFVWAIGHMPVVLFGEGCKGDRKVSLGPSLLLVILTGQEDAMSGRQDPTVGITSKQGKEAESLETPSQSLKRASLLLSRAATTLEDDEAMTVQLIRQVISILKDQVIPPLLVRSCSDQVHREWMGVSHSTSV